MGCGACTTKQGTQVLPSVTQSSVAPGVFAQLRAQQSPQQMIRLLREWTKLKQANQDSIAHFAQGKRTEFLEKLSEGPPVEYRWEAWKAALEVYGDTRGEYERWAKVQVTPQCMSDIAKDVPRTFPEIPYFKGNGATSLTNVLHAIANADPEVGYCQGMNCVIALLLLVGNGNEADVFAVYQAACRKYQWRGLYLPGFPKLWELTFQWQVLFKNKDPGMYRSFKEMGLKEALWLTKAVLTLYAASLPLFLAIRVWDLMLSQGESVILRTAKVILDTLKSDLGGLELADAATVLRDLNQRNIPMESFLKAIRQEAVPRSVLEKGTARYHKRKSRISE